MSRPVPGPAAERWASLPAPGPKVELAGQTCNALGGKLGFLDDRRLREDVSAKPGGRKHL